MRPKPTYWTREVGWFGISVVFLSLIYLPSYVTGEFMPEGTDALIWQPTLLNYLRDVGFIDRPLRNWLGYYDLYHNPHFGIDYPLLYLGVPELSLYSAYQWDQLYIWVHRLIMLGGAYVFVRAIGGSRITSAGLGVVFTLLPHFQIWDHWVWTHTGYSWLPWLLAAPGFTLIRKNMYAGFVFGVFGVVLMSFGNPLPLAQASVLYLMVTLFASTHSGSKIDWTGLLVTFGAPLIGGLVAGYRLLPLLSNMGEYIRWAHVPPPIEGGMKPTYEQTLANSAELSDLIGILLPVEVDNFLGSAHVGVAVFFLFLLGVSINNRRSLGLFALMSFIAVFFALDALGDMTPVHRLTYDYLPVFNSLRYTSVNLLLVAMFFFVFAVRGVETTIGHARNGNAKSTHLKGLSVLVVTALVLTVWKFSDFTRTISWLTLAISLFCILIYWWCAARKSTYIPFLVLLLPVLFFPASMHQRVKFDSTVLACPVVMNLQTILNRNRENLQGGATDVDIMSTAQSEKNVCGLLSNRGYPRSIVNLYGIRTPLGSAMSPRPLAQFRGRFNMKINTIAKARLFGITHVLTDKELPEFILLDQQGGIRLYATTVPRHLILACKTPTEVLEGQCVVMGEDVKVEEKGGRIRFHWPGDKEVVIVRRFAGSEWRVSTDFEIEVDKYETGDLLLTRVDGYDEGDVELVYVASDRNLGVFVSVIGSLLVFLGIALLRQRSKRISVAR